MGVVAVERASNVAQNVADLRGQTVIDAGKTGTVATPTAGGYGKVE